MTDVKVDGRDTRWAAHRTQRRRELVSHALRAIRVHGGGVSMDEIAARAGTSKTVVYRHFGDRAGLYAAIVDSVHDYIHAGVTEALTSTEDRELEQLVHDLADAYLRLVERDPEIYRFVLHRPPGMGEQPLDPAGSLIAIIGDHVADAIGNRLAHRHLATDAAATWGHGLVGFIRASADRWMAADPRPPRDVVVAQITALFAPAFAGALRE